AVVFQLPTALVEKAAHHQHHRAVFCGGPPPNAAHGLLCQREECGSYHLLHLPALQPGMENPHPPRFYTRSLTSPKDAARVLKCTRRSILVPQGVAKWVTNRHAMVSHLIQWIPGAGCVTLILMSGQKPWSRP